MNFYEAQEFFKTAYPSAKITFEFDDKCCRVIECVLTDGQANVAHHVECNKVKVTIEGTATHYVPIAPHRTDMSVSDLKKFISEREVYIHPNDIEIFRKVKNEDIGIYEQRIKEWMDYTGLTREQLEKKIS